MKLFLASVLLVAVEAASLIGREHCTWGPSYWCSSLQTATACKTLSHCVKKVWEPRTVQVQQTKECLYSQKLVKTVRRVLSMEKGHGEASYLLASMCSFVRHDGLRKECKELVTDFMPEILTLVESDMEPSSVARVLGLCRPLDARSNKTPHLQKSSVAKQMSRVSVNTPLARSSLKALLRPKAKAEFHVTKDKAKGSVECEICTLVVSTLDQLLAQNSSEAAVQQFLDDICNVLPAGIRPQCLSFVNKYAAVVWKMLIQQELDPQQLCTSLGLCQSSAEARVMNVLKEQRAGSGECELCKQFVSAVDTLLAQNSSEAEFQQILDDICNILPSGISPQCLSFVDEYAAAVWNMLIQQELDPVQVCTFLNFCQSSAAAAELRVPAARTGQFCTVCELLIGEVEVMITTNKSEAAIEKALEKVCSLLPSQMVAECDSVVTLYTPVILNLLVQAVPPHEICYRIGLCNASRTVQVAVPKAEAALTHKAQGSADSVECEVCKDVVAKINTIIGENTTEQEIIHEVQKICDLLQGDLVLECKSEVQNYGPAVLNLLQHLDDPAKVCAYFSLCDASAQQSDNSSSYEHKELLGSEECTYGPAFWCANMENARKCGMEQECVKKYGLEP